MMKRHDRYRLKAVSVPSALVLGLVVWTVLAVALGCMSLGDRLIGRMERMEQAKALTFAFCRAYERMGCSIDSIGGRMFGDCRMAVKAKRSMHGLYDLLEISCLQNGKPVYTSKRLAGVLRPGNVDCGLYVPDDGALLNISGDCRFASPLFVPNGHYAMLSYGEVRTGYRNDTLKLYPSEARMPELSEKVCERVNTMLEGELPECLVLTKSDTLSDRVIAAKKIVVEDGYRGSVQLFATDSIRVEGAALLEYPSGLCLWHDQNDRESDNGERAVLIRSGAIVEGYAVCVGGAYYLQEPESAVRGMVYCDGRCCVGGYVSGVAFLSRPEILEAYGRYSWALTGLVQTANRVYACPELFAQNSERKIIKEIIETE